MIFPVAKFDLNDPTSWFMIAIAGATVIYTIVRPMMRKNDPLKKQPSFNSLAQQRSVERQMQNLLVELSEMARQITAQLDTRSQKLQLLITEADDKIAELQKAVQHSAEAVVKTPAAESVEASVFSSPPQLPDPGDDLNEEHRRVYTLADGGMPAADIARETGRPRGEIDLILGLRTAMPA